MSAEKVLELHFGSDFWLLGDETTKHILSAMEEYAKQSQTERERKLYVALEDVMNGGTMNAKEKALKVLNECKPNK